MGHHHDHANEHSPLISHDGHDHGSTAIINNCSNIKEDSSAKSTKKRLAIASTIALAFFATELVAGYFANSLGKEIKKK
jgi:Co/Zn/Cd efflux system component